MLKAVLFDMDGTVLDTEPVNKRAWEETLISKGYFFDDGFFEKCIGLNYPSMEVLYKNLFGSECLFTELSSEAHKIVDALDEKNGVAVKKGFFELSGYLKKRSIKSYIVTSSRRKTAEIRLGLAGILDCFDGIVGGDDVERGKPEPEPYQKAAELAGAAADECIAVEDSVNGIKSAFEAGIRCVFIKDLIDLPDEISHMAHRLNSLDELVNFIQTD